MFVQVIQGKIADPQEARDALDRWAVDLAPDASGWLGSTAGVTEDGTFIALARCESEDQARRNSERVEQGQWWAEISKLFTAGATFRDSTHVTVDVQGDPDTAGFVQVMQGRGSDPERARELMSADSTDWAEFRPDVLGSVAVEHEGGGYTMAIYVTSEEEAREGEQKEMPPEMKAQMEEMDSLTIGETLFFDLKQPWTYSPR